MGFAALAGVAGMAAVAGGGVASNAGAVRGSIAPNAISASGLALLNSPPYPQPTESPSPVSAAEPEPTPTALLPSAPLAPLPDPTAPMARRLTPPSAAMRTHSSSTPPSTLGDEIARLDRGRTALGAGDAPHAVQLVDDYERRWPRGAFLQEAEMLRIEALVREGERDAASGAADRFLVAYPASPHLARLRALTGSAGP
jgi:hypothetical protein